MSHPDTIAAISTPIGLGGIGIIRISGPLAFPIARKLFRPTRRNAPLLSHFLTLGLITDPVQEAVIDQVLMTTMKAPHSYTREDVVEINCHSGLLVLKKILELVLKEGARLAEPGEFTWRAFMNGRIDLTQAEGIIELLRAKTDQALIQANALMAGALGTGLKSLQEELLSLLAHLEAAIDFPEEEIEIFNRTEWNRQLQEKVLNPLGDLVKAYEEGRLFREGLSLVIVGKPNVGKSSLLNRLLREERAIVTSVPGTTRDTIEETFLLKGLPFRLIDTAGIRRARDEVEEAGIRRTRQKVEEGDLVLFMVDASAVLGPEDREIFEEIQEKPVLILANKKDLPPAITLKEVKNFFPGPEILSISALSEEGIEMLKEKLSGFFLQTSPPESLPELIPTLRQKRIAEQMLESLRRAYRANAQGLSPEFIALDLQQALEALGTLIGATTADDVLKKIFSDFCIGK